MNKPYTSMTIRGLMNEVRKDWKKPYFGAVPYIQALSCCETMDSPYLLETARDLVPYFLCNSGTWRGEIARSVKAELKRRLANVGK